jgi:hypothetical protein
MEIIIKVADLEKYNRTEGAARTNTNDLNTAERLCNWALVRPQ